MHLYNLTLLPPSSITQAVVGSFSGTRAQEICVVRGSSRLELLRLDKETGKMASLLATDVFGVIRSIAAFRLTGGSKGVLQVLET
jgi:splicing factor 3B subunit 3